MWVCGVPLTARRFYLNFDAAEMLEPMASSYQ